MTILKEDMRWLTDTTPISYQAEDIVFHELTIKWIFAHSIENMLKWKLNLINFEPEKINFNAQVIIYDIWWNNFILEYTSQKDRDSDIKLLKEKFKPTKHFAEVLENWRQVPSFDWYFEYEWKYYIIVDWLNSLTDEIDPEKWIYKWVVVNPSKYFKEWINTVTDNTAIKVENIITKD
ncbi:MAG: hypothetical protein ACD_2C00035G0003 [uncultured bacterium (gcode 4)]|uniref:Uncharacterized protein n=1 Tax=uncultured bacterium (gcode 4) TaxID=1234023 RepID=K2GIA6_9BACT|nr:MAG: hypothetical protein ACD_2C00035G0003 [uncultured bacterium (gcode 4)]